MSDLSKVNNAALVDTFADYWSSEVQSKLFRNDSFMDKFRDVSSYILGNGRTLRVPYMNHAVTIGKNQFGASPSFSANQSVENILTLELDVYNIDPQKVEGVVEYFTKFGKLENNMMYALKKLENYVANDCLYKLYQEVDSTNIVTTSGATGVANSPAGGNKKKFTKADVLKVAKLMDEQDVPTEGRYMLLNPTMYSELLESVGNASEFGKDVLPTGVVTQVAGINIMKRSFTGSESTSGTVIDLNATQTGADAFVGLSWHEDIIYKAKGYDRLYTESSAIMRGEIFSYELVCDVTVPRSAGEKVGLIKIVQG